MLALRYCAETQPVVPGFCGRATWSQSLEAVRARTFTRSPLFNRSTIAPLVDGVERTRTSSVATAVTGTGTAVGAMGATGTTDATVAPGVTGCFARAVAVRVAARVDVAVRPVWGIK